LVVGRGETAARIAVAPLDAERNWAEVRARVE
jgi:hypothetical protein